MDRRWTHDYLEMNVFCPLASGSKGNSIFLATPSTRILIDAGLSPSNIIKRLEQIGVSIETIQAILITHEHIDHIQGAAALSEKYNIPLFANAETAKGILAIATKKPRFKIFTTGESFLFGDLKIHPFTIPHDTLDPVAFTIITQGLKFGICTDLGHVTSSIRKQLEYCDILYIEANHEPSMVHASARPLIYKTRVLSKQGHLSNQECAALIQSILHPQLKHIYLAHLSSECNSSELALKIIEETVKRLIPVSIAYQDTISKEIKFDLEKSVGSFKEGLMASARS
jgi:phosphoribosyl 1,2-cyclic phosphodiesterase